MNDPTAVPQAYAAWRRTLLASALVATVLGAIAHGTTWEFRFDFGNERPSPWLVLILVLFAICAFAPGLVGSGLAVAALAKWRRLRSSCRLSRYAWMVWVLGPLPVLLLPVSHLFRLDESDAIRTSTNQIRSLITVTAPAVFALLPGALNAALVLERFLPESRAPGLILMIMSPACAIAYLLPIGVIAQVAFQTEIYFGLLLLACSPLVPLAVVRRMTQPNTPGEAARLVRRIGVVRGCLSALGAVLVVGWVGKHPQLRAWIGQVDFVWVLGVVAKVLASKWITTVVVTDLLITMLHQGREAASASAGTAAVETLAQKLDALSSAMRPGVRIADAGK